MEMAVRIQGPSCCRRSVFHGTQIRIKPAVLPFSQSFLCYKCTLKVRLSPSVGATSSDYSRRRPRKTSIPKTRTPSPKGFGPRPQVGTSTQKKEKSDTDEEELSEVSSSSEYSLPSSKPTSKKVSGNMRETGSEERDKKLEGEKDDLALAQRSPLVSKITEIVKEQEESREESDDIAYAGNNLPAPASDEVKKIDKRDETASAGKGLAPMGYFAVDKEQKNFQEERDGVGVNVKYHTSVHSEEKVEDEVASKDDDSYALENLGALEIVDGHQNRHSVSVSSDLEIPLKTETKEEKLVYEAAASSRDDSYALENLSALEIVADRHQKGHTASASTHFDSESQDVHGFLLKDEQDEKLVKEEIQIDAQQRRGMLEELTKMNFSAGNKVFVFPQAVKPDRVIEIFFNRRLSALMSEPNVLIKGAFNGWRWKSFTEKMSKTDLKGDWWSCQIYVPKEAYKIDFVFFNGSNIYENNNWKDFCIPVEGGPDELAFEDFLLEEKRKELERLAAEQAERERQAEEQRRREAEKVAIEADRTQAKVEVEKRRESLQKLLKLAADSVEGVWRIVPSIFKCEDKVRIYYDRTSRPLVHAGEIWIHGGHNNWAEGLSIVEKLVKSESEDGDWWYAEVVVPDRALVLDWVFADGPPKMAKVYDNNNYHDFHVIVPKQVPQELFWVEEEQKILRKLQEDRKRKEEAARAKADRTQHMKAETKERTLKQFLLSQKNVVYTEPLDVRAGSTVTVYYNPSNTVLSGKPEVWFKCSFNRWTHRNGPLPPQKMVPSGSGPHLKAIVKVPMDAYIMDFVFSEREDGGIYDNRNGMDYHIPVSGGLQKAPPMHIVHIAVEMAPIAKVGGLGDVVTSLSRAVQDLGHRVDIILPKYDCMNLSNVQDFHYSRSFSWDGTEVKVWFGKVADLPVHFLEPQNGLFWVGCIYGRNNDGHRFGFFCHAALEYLRQTGARPDVLHCHDWSSAPVAWLFKEHYRHLGLNNARVVFTIHNLEFGAGMIGKAMQYSDKATTVSHTYSREVSGNPAIAPHYYKFHGIRNGIDPDIWDPYNDNFIPVSYTSENVVEGKKAAKLALQQRLGLRQGDHPLVGIITRLTIQKGIHLIKHAIWKTIERHGQVVLLGSAPDPRIQNDFVNLANQLHSSHGDRVRLCLTYDEPLSHLIYAGADFILVPSIFEPCGLTQLIAMRYGAIPVVRKTGGLYDTVFDVDNDKERALSQGLEPNGFSFDGADTAGVDYALNRAISAWYDGRQWFYLLCKRVMEQDWSWNRPALDYIELYYSARK